jgi:hypothetical protein
MSSHQFKKPNPYRKAPSILGALAYVAFLIWLTRRRPILGASIAFVSLAISLKGKEILIFTIETFDKSLNAIK